MLAARDAAPSSDLAQSFLRAMAGSRAKQLAFVRRRMASPADAEDVLQTALWRASRHLDELRASDRAEAWFWRILRNTVADENERLGRERRLLEALAGHPALPEHPAESGCACSLGVLDQMKPEYREVLHRADLGDQPLVRVAEDLGITVGNVNVRLHRARKAMRAALRDHCGTDSPRACQECACEEWSRA